MQRIPFFELFTSLPLSRDLRALLDGAFLTAVEVARESRTMDLALTVRADLGEKKDELAAAAASAYALERVAIHHFPPSPGTWSPGRRS